MRAYINLRAINLSLTAVVKGSDQLKREVLEIKVNTSDSLDLNFISNNIILISLAQDL